MSDLWRLWNPFSKRTKHIKSDAKEDRSTADKILVDAARKKAFSRRILEEQKKLSAELRDQQRKNHFSELFQSVPIKPPHPKRS